MVKYNGRHAGKYGVADQDEVSRSVDRVYDAARKLKAASDLRDEHQEVGNDVVAYALYEAIEWHLGELVDAVQRAQLAHASPGRLRPGPGRRYEPVSALGGR
jgi:hypothetical protein